MMQAYYSADQGSMRFAAYTPALAPFLDDLEKLLTYETPTAYHGSSGLAPARHSLVGFGEKYLAFFRTRPTETRRDNTSFTHVIVVDRRCYPLVDLLVGYGDPFWKEASDGAGKSLDPVEAGKLPWDVRCRRKECDAELASWLDSDPGHPPFLQSVLTAHLNTRREDARVFLAAQPEDVFWAVYGAARLLPESLASKLTFSTYEREPFQRRARVVGTWGTGNGTVPEICRAPPNTALELHAGRRIPLPDGVPAAKYAALAISLWRDEAGRAQLDRFRLEAPDTADPGELEIGLRAAIDLGEVSNDELRQLAHDPAWASRLADNPAFFTRLIECGELAEVRSRVATLSDQKRQRIVESLVPSVQAAIVARDIPRLARLLDGIDCLPPPQGATARRAISAFSPTDDSQICRVLLRWLETSMIHASVIDVSSRLVAELVAARGNVAADLMADWLVASDSRLSPDVLALAVRDEELWEALEERIRKLGSDPLPFINKLLGTLSKDDPSARKVLDFACRAAAAAKDPNVIETVVESLCQAELFPALELLERFHEPIIATAQRWDPGLRVRLAKAVLSDSEAGRVMTGKLDDALLSLGVKGRLNGSAADRWDALQDLRAWLETARGADLSAERVAKAVETVAAWHSRADGLKSRPPGAGAAVTGFPAEVYLGPEILDRLIDLVAESSADNPRDGAQRFVEFHAQLRPVWSRFGLDVFDQIAARLSEAHHGQRQPAMHLAMLFAADGEEGLREPVGRLLRTLPDADLGRLLDALRQHSWLVRFASKERRPVTAAAGWLPRGRRSERKTVAPADPTPRATGDGHLGAGLDNPPNRPSKQRRREPRDEVNTDSFLMAGGILVIGLYIFVLYFIFRHP